MNFRRRKICMEGIRDYVKKGPLVSYTKPSDFDIHQIVQIQAGMGATETVVSHTHEPGEFFALVPKSWVFKLVHRKALEIRFGIPITRAEEIPPAKSRKQPTSRARNGGRWTCLWGLGSARGASSLPDLTPWRGLSLARERNGAMRKLRRIFGIWQRKQAFSLDRPDYI